MENREYKPHTTHAYKSRPGRSTVVIICPYCGEETTCYVWSLAGGGKKCKCGALHTSRNTFEPVIKKK